MIWLLLPFQLHAQPLATLPHSSANPLVIPEARQYTQLLCLGPPSSLSEMSFPDTCLLISLGDFLNLSEG